MVQKVYKGPLTPPTEAAKGAVCDVGNMSIPHVDSRIVRLILAPRLPVQPASLALSPCREQPIAMQMRLHAVCDPVDASPERRCVSRPTRRPARGEDGGGRTVIAEAAAHVGEYGKDAKGRRRARPPTVR